MSRREKRYQNRQAKRLRNRVMRSEALGSIEEVFSFHDLYRYGKKCCNGVRWKQSTQNFERHAYSITAKNRKAIIEGKWKPSKYAHFTVTERGKTRPIDAPHITDRQVHKVLTNNVLLPLYTPSMIHNNGASLKGKGYAFAKNELAKDLRKHYRKYGMTGHVILLDFKQFFPTASHRILFERHERYIFDPRIRKLADDIVKSMKGDIGLPLGVEPSQIEMIAYPSALDNYIKCQLSIKCMGHYMDDYYIIVPPDKNPHEILAAIIKKAEELELTISHSKTRIIRFGRPFRYCKAKYTVLPTGKVLIFGSRESIQRDRRKIKAFKSKVEEGLMTMEDVRTSITSALGYLSDYHSHNKVLQLRRLFYTVYGFSCEDKNNFKRRTPCVI